MRILLSGLVLTQLLGCHGAGVEQPNPSAPAADSVAWRRLLAPAIADFLRKDSTTAPSQIIAREPASKWTHRLVFEVHRELQSNLNGLWVDRQRTLELRDPVSSQDPRILIEVPIDNSRCVPFPTGGQGGYHGSMLAARVIRTPDGLEAEVVYEGNFDGICTVQPGRE